MCVQGESQTRELSDCSVPKEPSCSLCHDGVSHQEESELNSHSGFPTETTAQNAHRGKKKKGIGMLWNPELADVKMA